jgi:hypothetical protein
MKHMSVSLQSTPIANKTDLRIGFFNGPKLLKSIDPDDAEVLTITFDTITLFNPPNSPVARAQNPGHPNRTVPPGEIAFVTTQGGQTLLHHAAPNSPEQIIRFGGATASKTQRKSKPDQGRSRA